MRGITRSFRDLPATCRVSVVVLIHCIWWILQWLVPGRMDSRQAIRPQRCFRVEWTKAYRCTKDMSLSFSSAPKPHLCRSRCSFPLAAPLPVFDPEVWHFPSSPQVSVTQPGGLGMPPTGLPVSEGTTEGCRVRISSPVLPRPGDPCCHLHTGGERLDDWSLFLSWLCRGMREAVKSWLTSWPPVLCLDFLSHPKFQSP